MTKLLMICGPFLVFSSISSSAGNDMDRILNALVNYKTSRPAIRDWKVLEHKNGIVETDWFKEHKGEVILKIRIDSQVNPYHVEVLQKIPKWVIFTQEVSNTHWATFTRDRILLLLEK